MPTTGKGRSPSVVLVGRPNVGKSTLFNRITRSRRAIVTAMPGTTRDALAQFAEWQDVSFRLVDTGGMFGASADPLHDQVVATGRQALDSADVIIFVVDGREGLVPADHDVAAAVRTTGAPVILAVNKMDDRRARDRALEFYQFGFEPVVEISAEHGPGVGDLLDEVVRRLPGSRRESLPAGGETPSREEGPFDATGGDVADESECEGGRAEETRVALVGRPNVGKSSLVNRLLHAERVMVSEMPGTTRDAIDAVLRWHRRDFRIVDTAGIRRPGRVARGPQVEVVSVLVARRAIERADVAALIVDASQGVTDQDAAIAGEADAAGCGVIIVANKWDLVKAEGARFVTTFDEEVRRRLKFLEHVPILHVSAVTGERVSKLIETIDRVAHARRYRVPTAELNRFVAAIAAQHPPRSPGRREVRILYAAQTRTGPPTFVLFTNVATKFHFSYERYIVNRLREAFGFIGTPIRLHVRRREKKR